MELRQVSDELILGQEAVFQIAHHHLFSGEKLSARLTCLEMVSRRVGTERSSALQTVWEAERNVVLEHSESDLRFDLPSPLLDRSGKEISDPSAYRWQLAVLVARPGADFEQFLPIEVAPVAGQGTRRIGSSEQAPPQELSALTGIQVTADEDGQQRIEIAPAYARGLAPYVPPLCVLGVVFTGVGFALPFMIDGSLFGQIFMGVIFVAVGVAISLLALNGLVARTVILISKDRLRVQKHVLGWSRADELLSSSIRSVAVVQTGSFSNGEQAISFHGVELRGPRPMRIPTSFTKAQADSLRGYLELQLNSQAAP